jgi:hypothetical protein
VSCVCTVLGWTLNMTGMCAVCTYWRLCMPCVCAVRTCGSLRVPCVCAVCTFASLRMRRVPTASSAGSRLVSIVRLCSRNGAATVPFMCARYRRPTLDMSRV